MMKLETRNGFVGAGLVPARQETSAVACDVTRGQGRALPLQLCAALFVVFICVLTARTHAQTATPTPSPQPPPPSTDIFLVEVTGGKGELKFGKAVRVTAWEGYDNQPSFTPDGRGLLYASIRADAQADIYRYDIASSATTQLTKTAAESEYSPTVTPDGKFFSVVRVEKDRTQRVWKFPLGGAAGGEPTLVLHATKPVGYHVWADAKSLMVFVLGTPVTMQLVDVGTELTGTVATNVGRSLHRIPKRDAISFVHKVSADEWLVKEFDLKTHRKSVIAKTLPGSEDYAWTPDGAALLMAKDSKLFMLRPGTPDAQWGEVADFSADGLKSITRLAISPRGDRLALVAQTQTQK